LLRETEFVDISNLLGEGFFADRVVSLLQKSGPFDAASEEVLTRVQCFLGRVLEGQEQIRSARLSSNTIESIDAYQRAIIAFQHALTQKTEDTAKAKFKELINEMNREVSHVLENKCVVPEKVKITLDFFKFVRHETLIESSEYFSHRVVLKWPKRVLFHRI
jgi:hypothetical protein